MLCQHCQKIRPPHQVPHADRSGAEREHWCLVKHYPIFDDLLASAEDGCELCAVFWPFVQHARSTRASDTASSDGDANSLYSGCSHDDPFEDSHRLQGNDKIATPFETFIYKTPDILYSDEGYQYRTIDSRTDEKNNAVVAGLVELAEEELQEDLCAGFPPPPSSSKRNEAIQWLLQDPKKYTGPEQLWVKSWSDVGMTEDDSTLRERTTCFAFTAGSLEEVKGMTNKFEYCLEGHVVARREAELGHVGAICFTSNGETLKMT
jgi:hypothetical protein